MREEGGSERSPRVQLCVTAQLHSFLGCCIFLRQIHMHFAFRVLSVPGRLIVELYSLLGCCVFLRQIAIHFAFRVLLVPGRLIVKLYSLLGCCVFLHQNRACIWRLGSYQIQAGWLQPVQLSARFPDCLHLSGVLRASRRNSTR